MPFPSGSYTPYGYLRNPSHRATAWRNTEGGNLRTLLHEVGVEWVYPLQRNPTAGAGIVLELAFAALDRRYATRDDFAALDLTSKYHSALIFGFDCTIEDGELSARFFLVGEDALCCQVTFQRQAIDLTLRDRIWSNDADPPYQHAFASRSRDDGVTAVLGRGGTRAEAASRAALALDECDATYARLLAEDDAFYATCPELDGDWPAGWREGLIYDFETTRMLVQPPRGVFSDVWPAWMVSWPRVVLAEGTLDMLRLGYADPGLAQRAILSMFRDAPAANVPCVFEGGEYNMVARDGSRCGTSPAWCLPFLNLELLYLRMLDREWLAQIYPYLVAYVDWWLEHRTDSEGWLVYKCTWEAGEDGNPRLDPSESGDGDISGHVRPVELQATMAHAADVLAFFATELGLAADLPRWSALQARLVQLVRSMYDAWERRYRDIASATDEFQPPRPDQPYWGVDSCRYSAQSLTPLLVGEPLDAEEIRRHFSAPWLLWPSWTYSIVESASAAGLLAEVGEICASVLERAYPVTTRHGLGNLAKPLPGASPEFWPLDWTSFDAHDAYGWGATTANLLIRQLFGFKEHRTTDRWTATLAPSFPPSLLQPGRRYAIRRLFYRAVVLDLSYTISADGLRAELELRQPHACRVTPVAATAPRYASEGSATRHRFTLGNATAYTLELD